MEKFIDIKLFQNEELIRSNNNIECKYNNGTLSFIDDISTKITINSDELIFERKNDEYHFKLRINKGKNSCTYKLLKQDITFDINCMYASFEDTDKQLTISYKLESNDFDQKIIITKY